MEEDNPSGKADKTELPAVATATPINLSNWIRATALSLQ
jgi:hypothetical protein